MELQDVKLLEFGAKKTTFVRKLFFEFCYVSGVNN